LSRPRLLLVSPVRNEAAHVAATIRSVASQTRPPDLWLIVDDGSTDATAAIVEREAAGLPWVRVLRTPPDGRPGDDEARLAYAAEARAFNWALAQADTSEFTHVGKLDGDIELPPGYFASLLDEFERDPALGLAGGVFAEQDRGGWKRVREPLDHVPGALKLYRRDSLEAAGGVREHLGWDTIDETYLRMQGWATRARADLVARHHRPWGSVGGRLRGRARYGACAYGAGQPFPWVLLRSVKIATTRPFGMSGGAFLFGYLRAAARRAPRVEDAELRRFARGELRRRLRRAA